MQDLFTPYKEKEKNSFVSTQNSTLLKMKYCVKNRTQSNQIKKIHRKGFLVVYFSICGLYGKNTYVRKEEENT